MDNGTVASRRNKQRRSSGPLLDAKAVAAAREALEALEEGEVGEHIGVKGVSKYAATHRFRAEVEGYSGWEWNAVVAWAPGNTGVTINEVALVQGGDALKAPAWVPYHERVRPGDLGPKDVLPPRADDPRLEGESPRRLSAHGLKQAQQRLESGEFGPTSPFARHAQFHCNTCAFFLPVENKAFAGGVCVNEYSADGHVVAEEFGCGAHSDTPPAQPLNTNEHQAFDDERPERFQVR
ncbi:DUF3027 domain-containing protein [Corynebacterium pelargi]|uniref:Uncharacterized protein n=1 Tax=Corynebacterium pelargi TaxID=1471400 RepID=A0A410WA27_9CORY|nr:DUF3027 domain-containing protein [Corynebacterium pelargi]QAU52833.1 hypothetical protein CPELA_07870 [Corynebacterium pelargi]GGG79062.1 hypothetical protein GCM10007338_16650 [Corynebacterium pelargi]